MRYGRYGAITGRFGPSNPGRFGPASHLSILAHYLAKKLQIVYPVLIYINCPLDEFCLLEVGGVEFTLGPGVANAG